METSKEMALYKEINLDEIAVPQIDMRTKVEEGEIKELAESIKNNGLIQPILVANEGNGYELIAGYRRLRAMRYLGMVKTVAKIIAASKESRLKLRFAENIDRENVDVVDEAFYLNRIKSELNISSNELAKLLGKSPSYISQRLAVVQYPNMLLKALTEKELSFTITRELATVTDAETQNRLTKWAVEGGANVGIVKQWIKSAKYNTEALGDEPPEGDVSRETFYPPTAPIYQECAGCGTPTKSDELVPLWFCKPCVRGEIVEKPA